MDHDWVSESTISQYEEEILGMQLDYGLDVAWYNGVHCGFLHLRDGIKSWTRYENQKVPRHCYYGRCCTTFCNGTHTPRSCMLTTVGRVLEVEE